MPSRLCLRAAPAIRADPVTSDEPAEADLKAGDGEVIGSALSRNQVSRRSRLPAGPSGGYLIHRAALRLRLEGPRRIR